MFSSVRKLNRRHHMGESNLNCNFLPVYYWSTLIILSLINDTFRQQFGITNELMWSFNVDTDLNAFVCVCSFFSCVLNKFHLWSVFKNHEILNVGSGTQTKTLEKNRKLIHANRCQGSKSLRCKFKPSLNIF